MKFEDVACTRGRFGPHEQSVECAQATQNMLAFDMGVWAPWGGRRERRFMLTAHVRNTEGEWVAKEEPGAQNIEDWTTGWEFAS